MRNILGKAEEIIQNNKLEWLSMKVPFHIGSSIIISLFLITHTVSWRYPYRTTRWKSVKSSTSIGSTLNINTRRVAAYREKDTYRVAAFFDTIDDLKKDNLVNNLFDKFTSKNYQLSYGLAHYIVTWFIRFVQQLWDNFIDFIIKELHITKENPVHRSIGKNMTIIDTFQYWKKLKSNQENISSPNEIPLNRDSFNPTILPNFKFQDPLVKVRSDKKSHKAEEMMIGKFDAIRNLDDYLGKKFSRAKLHELDGILNRQEIVNHHHPALVSMNISVETADTEESSIMNDNNSKNSLNATENTTTLTSAALVKEIPNTNVVLQEISFAIPKSLLDLRNATNNHTMTTPAAVSTIPTTVTKTVSTPWTRLQQLLKHSKSNDFHDDSKQKEDDIVVISSTDILAARNHSIIESSNNNNNLIIANSSINSFNINNISIPTAQHDDMNNSLSSHEETVSTIATVPNITSSLLPSEVLEEVLQPIPPPPQQVVMEEVTEVEAVGPSSFPSHVSIPSTFFTGRWKLSEYRYADNENENSTPQAMIGPLQDILTIPALPPPRTSTAAYPTIIQSSLNGSIGQDWSFSSSKNTTNEEQVVRFECHILRGVSQTKWLRNPYYQYTGHSILSSSDTTPSKATNPLIVSVIRPPKAPYDQLPTHCIYRGEVVEVEEKQRIIGKVYTAASDGMKEEDMRCIGTFEMYKL